MNSDLFLTEQNCLYLISRPLFFNVEQTNIEKAMLFYLPEEDIETSGSLC